MSTVVIEPPEPIVTPADVPGSHEADDPRITALILAATEEIDGPTGWVGRAFGPQTLEKRCWGFDPCGVGLDCPPIIEIVSVTYDGTDGTEQTIDPENYVVRNGIVYPTLGHSWPTIGTNGVVRIRYLAGYDGETTGNVPERAKQAIILSVGEMKSISERDMFLSERTVQGVGTRRYVVSAAAGEVIQRTTRRLLNGLWVPRV